MCLNGRMRELTVASIFVNMAIEGASKQGVDCGPILLRNNISSIGLARKEYRIPIENFAAAVVGVMQALDDECLGLSERRQPLGSFSMMCRANINAETIKRALQRTANYWNLFENSYQHQLIVSGGRAFYQLSRRNGSEPMNNYLAESLLSAIHRFHCWLAGQFIPLISVSSDFPEPEQSEEYLPLYYGAPRHYGHDVCGLEFESRYLDLDIIQTPKTLDQYLSNNNLSVLYQPKRYRVLKDQLRQWLEARIVQEHYQVTLQNAAQHFSMSGQALSRRLKNEGTSFKEMKMQTRRDISIYLLFSNKYKIEEIASLVGFSEASVFTRAFKAWTGLTPLHYRQQNQ